MKFSKIVLLLFLALSTQVKSQTYTPTKENLENRKWFQDAKFGLFIHWGTYAVLANGEWVMQNDRIDKATYKKLPALFNPSEFDAEAWVLMAKSAGMKYITITSKHHDGFAMYDSKHTDWDIVDQTVYKKDVLKQLAEACQKHDLKLFFYYSQLDWYQNDYYPRGNTGHYTGRPDQGDWNAYIDFMNHQLEELLTNYGEIGGIWFDGWWDNKKANWRLNETYQLIHRLQPATMIGSNHHQPPMPHEDFQMFEKDLPGHNTTGFSGESKIGKLPLETAETMNNSWGFNLKDKRYKSSRALIQYLVKAAGYNSNFLLNVGPMANGKIQPEFIDTLKVVGKWTEKFGRSIYGTRGGPVAPQLWGVSTQKDNHVFVHVLDWPENNLLIPKFDGKITKVMHFDDQKPLKFKSTEFGTIVVLPENYKGPDLIIELVTK